MKTKYSGEEIRQMYADGMTYMQIHEKLGAHISTIHFHIRRNLKKIILPFDDWKTLVGLLEGANFYANIAEVAVLKKIAKKIKDDKWSK